MPSQHPILVVGAGPAGLALALSLLKHGVPVRIIDKDPKFHEGSRGAGIAARSMEIYQFLGISQDVERHNVPLRPMRSYKVPGGKDPLRTFDHMESVDPSPSRPYLNWFHVMQHRLEEILRVHIARYDCKVELGTELVGFDQDVDGVSAKLRCQIDGQDSYESIKASFLLGADGARGTVRKILGLKHRVKTQNSDECVVGDVQIPNLSLDYWHMWETSGCVVSIRPIDPSKQLFSFGILGAGLNHATLSTPDDVLDFVRETTGRTELEFGHMSWLSSFKPNVMMLEKFGEGRVFVAGDAAHVHPPTGGQFNLAWKLVLVYRGISSLSLLSTYTVERTPVIHEMLRQTSDLYAKIAVTPQAVSQDGENHNDACWERKKHLQMLEINYRWSPIVLEERTRLGKDAEALQLNAYGGGASGVCAGDRTPDAPALIPWEKTEYETSLFKLLDTTRHTAIIFPGEGGHSAADVDAVLRILRSKSENMVQSILFARTQPPSTASFHGVSHLIVDRDGYAHASYAVDLAEKGVTVVIVRPDAYIGAVVKSVDGVERYFAGIFR